MRYFGSALSFAAMLTATPALALAPSAAQLARAIADFTDQPVAQSKLRAIQCVEQEDPTEFTCTYTRQERGRWMGYSAPVAIEGKRWVLIDLPARTRR